MPVNYSLIQTVPYRRYGLDLIPANQKCVRLIPERTLPRRNVNWSTQREPNRSTAETLPSCRSVSHPCDRHLFTFSPGFHFRRKPRAFLGSSHLGMNYCVHLVHAAFSWEILGWFLLAWFTTTWHTVVATVCWLSNKYLLKKNIWSFPFILK